MTPEGAVDLYDQDDGSGRQRWVLVPQDGGAYHLIRVYGGTSAGGPFGAARNRSSLTYVCPVDKRVTRILGAPATLGLRDGLAYCGSVGARWLRLVWDPR